MPDQFGPSTEASVARKRYAATVLGFLQQKCARRNSQLETMERDSFLSTFDQPQLRVRAVRKGQCPNVALSAPDSDRFLSLIEQMRLLIDDAVASDEEQRRAVAQAALALSPGEIIELVIGARRVRNKHFGKTLFGEPAWDILLELFVAHQRGVAVNLGAATTAGETPSSTGTRWIILLEQEGWIERRGDPEDAGRNLIGLTADGVERMEEYATAFAAWAATKARLEKR